MGSKERLKQQLEAQHGAALETGDLLFYLPAAGRHLIEVGTGDPTTTGNTGLVFVSLDEAADDGHLWLRLGDGSAYTQLAVTA